MATVILEKGKRNVGDHVALVYPPSLDLIAAFYGCLYVGCVPVIIRPPHPHNLATTLPTLKMIVEASHSTAILSNSLIIRSLRSKVRTTLNVNQSTEILLHRPKWQLFAVLFLCDFVSLPVRILFHINLCFNLLSQFPVLCR